MPNPIHVVLVAATLVGCTPEAASTDFGYRSTLARQTSGLELHEDGTAGHAGMFGTNCPFETVNGTVTGDYDLPDENEEIQDAEPTVLGEITVAAVVEGAVHVLDKTDGDYTHVPVPAPDVDQARLLTDGVVTLDGNCTIHSRSLEGDVQVVAQASSCEGADLEVDALTGVGLLAAGERVLWFGDGEPTLLDTRADLVSWDPTTSAFYTAIKGDTTLTALEADGSVRWSVDTPGPIFALDDAGRRNGVATILEQPNGMGWVALYDGLDGAQLKVGETPSTADALSVSGNGEVIALVRLDQTYFYDIH